MFSFAVLAAFVMGALFLVLWLVVSSALTRLVGPKHRVVSQQPAQRHP
jgi:hypothetical protein